eukprot:g9815.t1
MRPAFYVGLHRQDAFKKHLCWIPWNEAVSPERVDDERFAEGIPCVWLPAPRAAGVILFCHGNAEAAATAATGDCRGAWSEMEDVVLPVRQEKLLEELASCQEEAPEEDAKFCDDFAAFQALRKRCLDQQAAAARRKEGDAQSQRLGWLQQLHQVSSAAEEAQQLVMAKLKHVEAEQRELERKTIWLRNHCQETSEGVVFSWEQLEALEHQDHLNAYAEQIAGRLEALCCFDSIAKELDDSELVSRPVQLEELLQRLEAAAAFVDLSEFSGLYPSAQQPAVCAGGGRFAGSRSLEDATSVDTQIFYTSFHMIAPSVKPAMSVLYRQSHLHRQYAATLDAAESSLADLRRSFPATHWEQATSYLLDTSSREIRCFEAFFEPRRPQEALQSLLKELCHRCCQVLLPALREHESWEALASAAELLKAELQDFRGALEVRLALREMFAAAQQQLVRLARQELTLGEVFSGLQVKPIRAKTSNKSSPAIRRGGQVPGFNDRALKLLAACYRVLETPDFESLANMLLGPSTKAVHLESAPAQLLRLSQLLRLREQLAAFEDDLLSTEVVRPSGVAGDLERLTRVTLKGWRLARHRRWEAEIREVCNGLLEHVIFDQLLEGEKGGIEERTDGPQGWTGACCKLLPSVAAHFRAFLGPTTSVLFEVLKERILKLHLLEAGPPAESLVRCLERILDHAATAHFSDQRCVDADSVQMEDALRAEEANKKSRPVMH